MKPRILHLYEPAPESPFLSAQAAANHWLAPALRALDHEVVARPLPLETPETLQELSRHFDVVHVFGAHPGAEFAVPAVQTVWRHEAARLPLVAHSWSQAKRNPAPPAAVVPPAIPTAEVEPAPARGDHLVTVAQPGDEEAVARAAEVARAVERELVVLASPGVAVPESRLVRTVDATTPEAPRELATAAACVSFTTRPAEVAAVTAMACGVPVLTLEGSAAAELIVSGECGYAGYSVEDVARWAERLDLFSPRLGRLRARTLFDVQSAARQLADLYASLARGERPRFRHPEEVVAAR